MRARVFPLLGAAAALGLLWALERQQAEVYRYYRCLGLEAVV